VVVLNKGGIDTGFTEGFFVPGFHEEAAFVSEHFRFDEFYSGNLGFGDFHRVHLLGFD